MKQSFYGGVHPNDRKELARHKEVAPLSAAPKQVVIAMAMHVGAPCKPIVAVGDQVKVGQKIGEIAGLGAPIHASVSGVVKAVEPRPYVGGGKVMSVVIENDFQDTWGSVLTPHPDYSKLSCEEIVEIVKEAGITGMGGAGFPTHVKISSGVGKVDTLILNGAECEPYITADHRLMLEQGERVIGGVRILMQAFGLKNAVIGVEANKEDAIEHLKALVEVREDLSAGIGLDLAGEVGNAREPRRIVEDAAGEGSDREAAAVEFLENRERLHARTVADVEDGLRAGEEDSVGAVGLQLSVNGGVVIEI